ncbi:MAG: TetR/AcrR family transcriptional regulator [Chloroflexi bacterium]|nr:TetR/AcrR family transcriptional regulator [Chloroflexota bacterium]
MSSASQGTAGEDARSRFKDRVREWREQAILQAVGELLLEQGCLALTMDDVARRVGVAKGSLYLHAPTRSDLVAQLLDRWMAEVPMPSEPPKAGGPSAVSGICGALFSEVSRLESGPSPAFPCCLHTSPCPHGWVDRWARLAEAYGLDPNDEAVLIGEALQALSSTLSVQTLVAAGKLEEARAIVARFAEGFVAPTAP